MHETRQGKITVILVAVRIAFIQIEEVMKFKRTRGHPTLALALPLSFLTLLAGASLTPSAAQEQASPSSPFAPLPSGGQWTYKLQIPKPAEVPVAPELVGMEGLIGSSVTHGMLPRKVGTWLVVVSVNELLSPSVAKATLGKELQEIFFPTTILTETRFQLSRRSKSTLVLEFRGTAKMNDPKQEPLVEAQWLAALPADGKTRVEEGAWFAEPIPGPIAVPAGQFKDLIHSRITKPAAGDYTVAHVVESWLARGVGLIKLAVLSSTGEAYYTLELVSYKLK